jgi:hypothetical protein
MPFVTPRTSNERAPGTTSGSTSHENAGESGALRNST